jgi:hypothetical protein
MQPINKRSEKAAAGIIGSSSRFERMQRDAGAPAMTPDALELLQHALETYAMRTSVLQRYSGYDE